MPNTSFSPQALSNLRTRARQARRAAKHVLQLIKLGNGVAAAQKKLETDAGAVNLEVAWGGEVLFEFDLDLLPAVQADLQTLLERIAEENGKALAQAEADL